MPAAGVVAVITRVRVPGSRPEIGKVIRRVRAGVVMVAGGRADALQKLPPGRAEALCILLQAAILI
jgi:hypothetical protein